MGRKRIPLAAGFIVLLALTSSAVRHETVPNLLAQVDAQSGIAVIVPEEVPIKDTALLNETRWLLGGNIEGDTLFLNGGYDIYKLSLSKGTITKDRIIADYLLYSRTATGFDRVLVQQDYFYHKFENMVCKVSRSGEIKRYYKVVSDVYKFVVLPDQSLLVADVMGYHHFNAEGQRVDFLYWPQYWVENFCVSPNSITTNQAKFFINENKIIIDSVYFPDFNLNLIYANKDYLFFMHHGDRSVIEIYNWHPGEKVAQIALRKFSRPLTEIELAYSSDLFVTFCESDNAYYLLSYLKDRNQLLKFHLPSSLPQ